MTSDKIFIERCGHIRHHSATVLFHVIFSLSKVRAVLAVWLHHNVYLTWCRFWTFYHVWYLSTGRRWGVSATQNPASIFPRAISRCDLNCLQVFVRVAWAVQALDLSRPVRRSSMSLFDRLDSLRWGAEEYILKKSSKGGIHWQNVFIEMYDLISIK